MSRYLALLLIIALPFSSCEKAKLKKRRKKEIERVAGTWHWNGFYSSGNKASKGNVYIEFLDSAIAVERFGETTVKILGNTYKVYDGDIYEFDPLVFECIECDDYVYGDLRYYADGDSIVVHNGRSFSSSWKHLNITATY